jgi:hypothetical protein
MEGLRLIVPRMRGGQPPHGHRVGAVPDRALPVSVQDLDRPQIALLTVRPRPGRARLRRRAQPEQGRTRHLRVLVEPQRLVCRHGFAPIRHGEGPIDALGFAEGLDGVFVLEVVEGGDPAQEGGLRRRRAGVGKTDGGQEEEHGERERGHRGDANMPP